ncbi:hypothetical protein HWV62_690, partial [Athelia sp. TMB]
MDDASAEPSLFFAGSDGEEDAAMEEPEPQSSGSRPKPALFLADSDDEEPHAFGLTTPTKRSIYIGYRKKDSDSDDSHRFDMTDLHPPDVSDFDQGADIPESEPIPRASSVSSMSSGPSINHKVSSPTPSIEIVEPPVKKRRIDPVSIAPPSTSADSIYLGSFIVGNAWSTARGKGYIKSGDPISIEREEQGDAPPPPKKKGNDKGKKKQLSIATMMKAHPKNFKKKTNSVVRLTNARGFEFVVSITRLAVKLTRLKGMIEFKRSTMVDCPAALHPGADLIISLSVYMLPSAFAKPLSANGNLQQHKNMFEEGQESQDEQNLRERKSSLLKLFDAVSLKPQVGPDLSKFKDKSDSEMHAEDVKKMTDTSKPKAAVRTEIVGDGEEVEVEEGEDLSENELDTIYK